MSLLVCPRCNAKVITDSIEDGRYLLDHALGLYRGKPCEDGKCKLIFDGVTESDTKKSGDTMDIIVPDDKPISDDTPTPYGISKKSKKRSKLD